MKHEYVNGQLRNMKKTWAHLKNKQKDWILQQSRNKYVEFISKSNRHPNKNECVEIVNEVYSLIENAEIWIPYNEIRKVFNSKLNKYKNIKLN